MGYYHKILGIDENCSLEEIKQAYRRLAKKYHPDINPAENAQQKFTEINKAYEVLIHEVKNKLSSSDKDTQYFQKEYEEFVHLVHEQARKKARLRNEKIERQRVQFRESGLQDVTLLFKYAGRVIEPLFGIFLISLPICICISEKSIGPFFYLFFLWVVGVFLLFDTYTKRINYFKLGSFYYSFDKIKNIYQHTNMNSKEVCFYSSGLFANSKPYTINLLKVKDIKLKNSGPLQHQAGYDRENIEIKMPRSQKAFIIHSLTSAIKITVIIACIIFLPFESTTWRFIFGSLTGFILSSLLLTVTRTSSKNAYLLSYAMVIKIILCLVAVICCTNFDFHHFNISTNSFIRALFVFMIFTDSILEQVLKISKRHLYKPILRRYSNIYPYFDNNYQLYLEIPGWTFIYPFVRWIF